MGEGWHQEGFSRYAGAKAMLVEGRMVHGSWGWVEAVWKVCGGSGRQSCCKGRCVHVQGDGRGWRREDLSHQPSP